MNMNEKRIIGAADRMETAARQMEILFNCAYGGTACELVEQLQKINETANALKSLMAIKELIIKGEYSDDRALELVADGLKP